MPKSILILLALKPKITYIELVDLKLVGFFLIQSSLLGTCLDLFVKFFGKSYYFLIVLSWICLLIILDIK